MLGAESGDGAGNIDAEGLLFGAVTRRPGNAQAICFLKLEANESQHSFHPWPQPSSLSLSLHCVELLTPLVNNLPLPLPSLIFQNKLLKWSSSSSSNLSSSQEIAFKLSNTAAELEAPMLV